MARKSQIAKESGFGDVVSNRPFLMLWLAQLISQSGDVIFNIAILWFVLTITNSVFFVGITAGIIILPVVIIAPIAGVYIDRYNRKDVLIAGSAFQGLVVVTVAILYLFGMLSIIPLLLLIFALECGEQFFYYAMTASIPVIMEPENLTKANSLISISSPINQITGYGIGGILIALFGVSIPIYYDALTFFIALAVILFINRRVFEIKVNKNKASKVATFVKDFKKGLKYVWGSQLMREILVFFLVVNSFDAAASTLVAPYAKFVLSGSSQIYGFILAAVAVGSILGAIIVGRMSKRIESRFGKVFFIACMMGDAVYVLLGLVPVPWAVIALCVLLGMSFPLCNIPLLTLLQTKVPKKSMGRVLSVLYAAVGSAMPVAYFLSGGIASFTGIRAAYMLYGALGLAVVAITYTRFKKLRDARLSR